MYGFVDAYQEQTDVYLFEGSEPNADGLRNFVTQDLVSAWTKVMNADRPDVK